MVDFSHVCVRFLRRSLFRRYCSVLMQESCEVWRTMYQVKGVQVMQSAQQIAARIWMQLFKINRTFSKCGIPFEKNNINLSTILLLFLWHVFPMATKATELLQVKPCFYIYSIYLCLLVCGEICKVCAIHGNNAIFMWQITFLTWKRLKHIMIFM